MNSFSLRATNFKCIGSEPQGFDEIRTINLIIGRNNSGKSTLVDLVNQAVDGGLGSGIAPVFWHKGSGPEFLSETTLAELELTQIFTDNTSGGNIRGPHSGMRGPLVGTQIVTRLIKTGSNEFVSSNATLGVDGLPNLIDLPDYSKALSNRTERNPLAGKQFRRLGAERNIIPEVDNGNLTIEGDGRGATNVIQAFLNKSHLPSELVEQTLLNALNEVFGPDGNFTRILCQHHSSSHWEIYLEEGSKGRIPLSQSGSGLKTITLALSFIHLLPVVSNIPIGKFVYAFEELENNLHPALQRRLLKYISDQAIANDYPVFITTHSSVAIDMFNRNPNAQIVHVTHDGHEARSRTVKAYIEHRGVLDDLDVRASDLLQSNGIIWVEGPSDRIYINRWIQLWSENQLAEGTHYQCVFYGGRLLAHLSGEAPDDSEDGISILRVNRNALVLIDSDRRGDATPLNKTKERIISEMTAIGGSSWVTYGREVENYIPTEALDSLFEPAAPFDQQADRHESFFSYLERFIPGKGNSYENQKPVLAEKISSHLTREQLGATHDLAAQLENVCSLIRKWNSL